LRIRLVVFILRGPGGPGGTPGFGDVRLTPPYTTWRFFFALAKEVFMRPVHVLRPVLLAAVLLGLGCASKNKGKVEGTKWSSVPATIKGQSLPAGALRLEFGSDGSLVYRTGPQTHRGTYSLGMGDRLTLNLNQELAGRKVHVETVVINGDRLTMTDSDGTRAIFDRVK
jgi:hypothetical protein